jgi:hypothetical protein
MSGLEIHGASLRRRMQDGMSASSRIAHSAWMTMKLVVKLAGPAAGLCASGGMALICVALTIQSDETWMYLAADCFDGLPWACRLGSLITLAFAAVAANDRLRAVAFRWHRDDALPRAARRLAAVGRAGMLKISAPVAGALLLAGCAAMPSPRPYYIPSDADNAPSPAYAWPDPAYAPPRLYAQPPARSVRPDPLPVALRADYPDRPSPSPSAIPDAPAAIVPADPSCGWWRLCQLWN